MALKENKWKVGDLAMIPKSVWVSIDGVIHLVDYTGPIISIKKKTKSHNSIYKYAISLLHHTHYTNHPIKPKVNS